VENAKGFVQEGLASWYGSKFHGRKTSNQEVYDMHAMTAAHKTLPFNTRVRVLNLENQREITVRINDRGPFIKGRIIDVSYAAAKKLLLTKNGIAKVRIKVVPTPQKQLSNLHESSNTLAIAGRNKNNLLRNWDLKIIDPIRIL
jgi:rare lipoprotein A